MNEVNFIKQNIRKIIKVVAFLKSNALLAHTNTSQRIGHKDKNNNFPFKKIKIILNYLKIINIYNKKILAFKCHFLS
jgi:hypothetical protein